MKKEYDEIMEHLQVTPQMRQRILEHIEEADLSTPKKVLRFPALKKALSLAACFVLLLAGVMALPQLLSRSEAELPPVLDSQGIEEVASLEELSKLVGFEITESFSLPFEVTERSYVSYWNDLAEIDYAGEGQSAVYRQSPGTEENSGDYTPYSQSVALKLDGRTVTLKGDQDAFPLALWTEGGYAYSLRLSKALSAEDWGKILG